MKVQGIKKYCLLSIVSIFLISLAFGPIARVVAQETSEAEVEKNPLSTAQERLKTRITYSCRDLEIDSVLMQLAELAKIDIIKSPKVTGNVTVKVTDVPLEEALNNILVAHGYSYIATENMIRVVPASELISPTEKLVTRIYHITYAEAKDVATALKSFISKKGEVAINESTSDIMITDIESKIKAIDKFVEEIDRITPQVLVEVRIYDITNKDRFDIGIDWSAGRNTIWGESDSDTVPFLSTEESRSFQSGAHEPYGRGKFDGKTDFTQDMEATLEFGILNPHLNISAALSMQDENLSATLLANPRVLVLDNETANFKIVSEIPYEERTNTSGSAGTMTTIKFKEVGIELQVTPHITRDGMLRLHITPTFGVLTGTSEIGAPTVDTRKVDTIALIKDGQTVVLGGLRKKTTAKQINKVPFFGDLPIIGIVFRSEGEEEVNSEIVVFITPRIITEPVLTEDEQQSLRATEIKVPEQIKKSYLESSEESSIK